jgi:hypothetical protein
MKLWPVINAIPYKWSVKLPRNGVLGDHSREVPFTTAAGRRGRVGGVDVTGVY